MEQSEKIFICEHVNLSYLMKDFLSAKTSKRGSELVDQFSAFRVFQEDQKVYGKVVETQIDDLSEGDVVAQVAYSCVNYKDALAATGTGKIMRRFPLIGGIDFSGRIVLSKDERFAVGDAILVTGCGLGENHDGGFSEYVRVPADWVVPLPKELDLRESMAIGTAGFTAALSVVEMERNGLSKTNGRTIVTGATGGVGSLAVQCLAAAGYEVTALTRKDGEHDFLMSIGATEVLSGDVVGEAAGPLEKARWSGAVDPVGGRILSWLTRTMQPGGAVACSGLTAGTDLDLTVLPFILRGIKLLGIDSSMCPMTKRQEVWQRLSTDLKPGHLQSIVTEITILELQNAFETLLAGKARGRFIVKLAELQ